MLILPYSSRREQRGEGTEHLRVGAAQAKGAAFACSWWRGFCPCSQRKSAWATKAERAATLAFLLWRDQRGPWELAFIATWAGGLAFCQKNLARALPLWLLARAGRGIAWRAVQAALHP